MTYSEIIFKAHTETVSQLYLALCKRRKAIERAFPTHAEHARRSALIKQLETEWSDDVKRAFDRKTAHYALIANPKFRHAP